MPASLATTKQRRAEDLALTVATHEAGHAVASALEGLYVYDLRANGTNGVTGHEPANDPDASARISASGYAAELLFVGIIRRDPVDPVDGGDFSNFKEQYPDLDPEEAAEAFMALIRSQVEVLREHEETLAALICELMEALEFEDGIVQGGAAAEILIDIPAFAQMMEREGLLEAVQERAAWRRP
jgi:hypothetical protein